VVTTLKIKILELMSHVNTKLKLKQETAVLEQQENNKSNQQSNKGKSNNDTSKGLRNPCRKHNGANKWKDCPNNKSSHNKHKVKNNTTQGDKHIKKDLHLMQATNKKTKITMVCINDQPEVN
jgi:hypothetical protein